MKPISVIMIVLLMLKPVFALGAAKPDDEKYKKGIELLVKVFGITAQYEENVKDDKHPGNGWDSRIQEWKGSSDKNSNKSDCSMLVYIVKGKDKASTSENPEPNLIQAMLKIDGKLPAKILVSPQSNVKSSASTGNKSELSTFNFEKKYTESKGGGSPEGNMGIAMIQALGMLAKEAMTPDLLKSKSTYNLISERSGANGELSLINFKSKGINDKPNLRETTCYNMKRKAYDPIDFERARVRQNIFEEQNEVVAREIKPTSKAVVDGNRMKNESKVEPQNDSRGEIKDGIHK